MDKAVRLLVRRQASDTDQLGEEMPNSRPWVLEDRNEPQSVLALWQYTLAERQRAFQELYAMKAQAFRLANHEHMYDGLPKGTAYVRVVGYVSKLDTDVQGDSFWFGGPKAPQQDWLGKRVFKERSSFGILGVVHGMEREMGAKEWWEGRNGFLLAAFGFVFWFWICRWRLGWQALSRWSMGGFFSLRFLARPHQFQDYVARSTVIHSRI